MCGEEKIGIERTSKKEETEQKNEDRNENTKEDKEAKALKMKVSVGKSW